MLAQQRGAFEHRLGVAKSVFNPVHKAVGKLGLTVSNASNAMYGLSDIISCMIRMSHTESYAGVASDTARDSEAERMRDGAGRFAIPVGAAGRRASTRRPPAPPAPSRRVAGSSCSRMRRCKGPMPIARPSRQRPEGAHARIRRAPGRPARHCPHDAETSNSTSSFFELRLRMGRTPMSRKPYLESNSAYILSEWTRVP